MAIFGQYSGGDSFNVAGNMDAVLKGQQNVHDTMLQAVEKFNTARQDMETLQKQTGAILSQYDVDDKGKPDATAPKYVHDLYKSVNNEGGVANMSRTQMIAGIKAYETGFGVEAKQVELAGAREGVRAKQNANNIAELQYKEALKARDDQRRIKEALKATEDARKAAREAKKTGEGKERFAIKVDKEDIMVDTKEITPLLSAVETAEKITDPKEREQAIRDANMAVEKYLYSKSRISKEYSQDPISAEDGDGIEQAGVANPLYRKFQSAFADPSQTEFNLTKGERPPEATIARGTTTAYIRTELAKQKAIRDITAEKQGLDVDVAKYNAGQTPMALATTKNLFVDETGKQMRERLGYSTVEYNDPKLQSLNNALDKNQGNIIAKERTIIFEGSSEKQKLDARREILRLKTERAKLQEQLKVGLEKNTAEVARQDKLSKETPEYKAGAVTLSPEGYREEYRNTQVQMVKSMQEQTDDEYAIMTNFFKGQKDGVPDSFSKEAFYQLKGIANPISIPLGGGNRYVEYNGEKKIVQDVQSQGMSVTDEEKMWKAGEFAKARNLNGVQANGFRFSGEVRVGDIDRAQKVKEELFTSTRALSSVDRMIEIAENASLFDKMLPTEISGIAQSLTNAAQSANRTEIGGSGAWSNQDQIYMDKVIRDPSGGFNAIFSTQAIASLKEYRNRLMMGMTDKGTVYGFAFERGGNEQGLDSSMSQFRVRFNSALARNMTEQEALEYAKGTLYANGSE